jgi:hypothetical protein
MIDELSIDEIADRILRERNFLGRTYYDKKDKLTRYVSVDKFSTIYEIFYDDLSARIWPYPSTEYKEMVDSFNKAVRSNSFVKVKPLVIAPTSVDGRRIGPFIRKIKSRGRGRIQKYDIVEARLEDYYFNHPKIFSLSKEKRLIDFLKYVEGVYKKILKID